MSSSTKQVIQVGASKKIGLIAGRGNLPHQVITDADKVDFSVYVAAIKGFSAPEDFPLHNSKPFGLGEIGHIIKAFKREKCTHVMMAGNIDRPDFKTIKPDLRGVKLLPKVIKAASRGDDALLRLLVNEFENEGFIILAPQDICETSLINEGVFGSVFPSPEDKNDIEKALNIATLMGAEDIGQGCVVCQGLVLAVEAQEGTDKMLERVAHLPQNIRGSINMPSGVLAKRLKPGQEARVDLPTIGLATIEKAALAGLSGIVVEAGKAFVLQKDKVRELANAKNIFILGYVETE